MDATITLPFPSLRAWPDPPGWAEFVNRSAPPLRDRFDLAILPRVEDPICGALIAAADVPIRMGFAAPRTRPHLTIALPQPGRRHVAALAVDLALSVVRLLGEHVPTDADTPRPCFVPTAADEAEMASVLGSTVFEDLYGLIVLHPGSGWPLKNWPPHRWGHLAALLARRYGVSPLVTGGPDDTAIVREVVDASGGEARGLAGRLSLGGLAALLRRARLVIATDSGPLHVAAMLDTPVVGLYGPADPLEFAPWSAANRHRVVRIQLPCSPCGTLIDPPCGHAANPRCITEITVDSVLAAVADLLGEHVGHGRTYETRSATKASFRTRPVASHSAHRA